MFFIYGGTYTTNPFPNPPYCPTSLFYRVGGNVSIPDNRIHPVVSEADEPFVLLVL